MSEEREFTYAPDNDYPGQWFDDLGATLMALGSPGLAWDLMKADISRGELDELVYRLGTTGLTEGNLTE